MNGRFFRRVAAQTILQLRHSLRCERAQRGNRTHRLGSLLPFAALWSNGGCTEKSLRVWTGNSVEFCKTFNMSAPQAAKFQCTAEHVVARCDGGEDVSSNIVAACKFCNSKRHCAKVPLAEAAYGRKVKRRLSGGKWHGLLVARLI
jgi:hypothetical protein